MKNQVLGQELNFCFLFSLRATRAKVWHGRSDSPLFCVKTYASNMERLFHKVWERHEKGEKPDHVTELSNY